MQAARQDSGRRDGKPSDPRRLGVKTDGAFGKEHDDRVVSGDQARNVDKAVKRTGR